MKLRAVCGEIRLSLQGKKLMNKSDRHAAFPDCARNSLDRTIPDVAGAEDSR
jgi:hypothetical protein